MKKNLILIIPVLVFLSWCSLINRKPEIDIVNPWNKELKTLNNSSNNIWTIQKETIKNSSTTGRNLTWTNIILSWSQNKLSWETINSIETTQIKTWKSNSELATWYKTTDKGFSWSKQ